MLKRLNLLTLIISILLSGMPVAAQTNRQFEREKSNSATTTSDKRIALVIGNSAYKNTAALPNPVNDATDMTKALTDLGFEVISGTDQTKAQMQNLIRQFGTRLADTKAVGLFFYAGHGISVGGTNYLIPVDADIQAEDEIEEASVSINFLLNKMAAAQNGFNMVILDACRNNPFARKWRNYRDLGDKGGLVRIDAPTGTLIAYATKPGEVASDGNGRNGLYTGALLRQMRQKNVDVTKMLQLVRADVIKQSNGKQVPFDESSLVGDFYFAGLEKGTNEIEEEFWNSIKTSDNPDDFRLYKEKFPKGVYTDLADLNISRLTRAKTPSETVTDNSPTTVADLRLTYFEYADGSYGFKNADGEIVEKTYSTAEFNEGFAVVSITSTYGKRKYGFIDTTKKLVIPLIYDAAESFENGLAKVKLDKKTGLINTAGKVVVSISYEAIRQIGNEFIEIKLNNKLGLIDKTGKEVFPPLYDEIVWDRLAIKYKKPSSSFDSVKVVWRIPSNGLIKIKQNGRFGYLDAGAKVIISPVYEDVSPRGSGTFAVKIDGKWGLLDSGGKLLVQPGYDDIKTFSEDFVAVKINQKWGFIDKNENPVIQPKYEEAEAFKEGFAAVSLNGLWGFVDKTGTEVIPLRFYKVGDFNGGYASFGQLDKGATYSNYEQRLKDGVTRVKSNLKFGFIDKTGKVAVSPIYPYLESGLIFSNGLYAVTDGNGWGYVDHKGTVIIPLKFGFAGTFNNGLAFVRLNNRDYCIDPGGNEVADKSCLENRK